MPFRAEGRLRERLDALGPAPRAELLHVLMLPDFGRADRIGPYYGNPATCTFAELLAELLIDCEADGTLRPYSSECCGNRAGFPGHWAHREPAPHSEPTI